MKYTDAKVVFRELPDEITLAINISGCPIHCPDCHSKYLWEDVGTELDYFRLYRLIRENEGITAVCFMGGDACPDQIMSLTRFVKTTFYNKIKTGWYSGQLSKPYTTWLDYVKLGPYVKECGPINKEGSNQKLYKNVNGQWKDITYMMYNNNKV